MLKRLVAVVRDARHGGTVIFLPSERTGKLCGKNPHIDIKYSFAEDRARCRYRDLIVGILGRLAQLYGTDDDRAPEPEPVGWKEFETTTDGETAALDEGIFEIAYMLAGLASADGAVVMSKHHELLGFGGMIPGGLPVVNTVARALDLEGERLVEESVREVGARHRSVYRLVGALPGVLAVVVSQDGGVRFVSFRNGRVTYWNQE